MYYYIVGSGHRVETLKKVKAITEEDGFIIFNLSATEAGDDWIRAGRLKKRADAGDKKAAAELERMENTPLFEVRSESD